MKHQKIKPNPAKDEPDPSPETNTNLRTEMSLNINAPFRNRQYAANKKLTAEELEKLEAAILQTEKLRFVVVGDLNLKNKFARSLLAITDVGIYGFDETYSDGFCRWEYAQLQTAVVKRYYSNAMLIFTQKTETEEETAEKTNFLRFTYREAPIFDAAANFINAVAGGADPEEEQKIMEAAVEKQFSICPKCGRTLIRPGAPCIRCQSKNKLFRKLAKYVMPYKWLLLLCLLISVLTTAGSLLPPYMTKILVDNVLPNRDKTGLVWCVLALLGTYVFQYSIGLIRGYYLKVSGQRIVTDLRNDVYEKAQRLPMRFYDQTSTGSIINRISGDSAAVEAFVLRVTQEVLVQLFLLIGIIIIMFSMNWQLTLLSLVPVPFVAIGSRIFRKKIMPVYRKMWRYWASVTGLLTDTIPAVRVIKAFANEKNGAKKFRAYNEKSLQTNIKSSKITNLYSHVVNFLIVCGSLTIWAVGGQRVIDDPEFISVGLLVSFISYTSMFYGPVNFFANFSDAYQSFLNAVERLMDIIDAEPEQDFADGWHPDRLHGKIEFKNVNFAFERAKKTLTDVNFVIEPGDIVGIVGTTGAGKSTIVNLLMRYYDHYEGEILIDDINIRNIDLEFYRSQIGYVQQEPMMFHDTIFQNIAYGSENAEVEAVIHAADVANAHNFICRLPDGYDTVLGERGVGLSGGERQRLSIARAVLRNPSILFFDEATASVDSETEKLIQDAIEQLIHGRTTIMIAHRLSTLRKANKIIVVDKGKILEMGTPEELMAQKGKYYKLIQIQTMSDELEKSKKEERFA